MEDNETTYQAVEKDGVVTAIWEMNGRKHVRTIDPRSDEGRRILHSHTADEDSAEHASSKAAAQSSEHKQAQ